LCLALIYSKILMQGPSPYDESIIVNEKKKRKESTHEMLLTGDPLTQGGGNPSTGTEEIRSSVDLFNRDAGIDVGRARRF
jgi:hypothetical protein